jgi:hypothetical protein
MALETVPLLREDSVLAWDIETSFKTVAPAATWQSMGRVDEWADLGPVNAVFRDAVAGAGREAATIGVEGVVYPPKTMGPWQVVDPRVLGFAWGQEEAAPVALGGGYYRHTVIPTKRGMLPSMSVQMHDNKAGTKVDGTTYLGVVMPKLGLRGEASNEDGSGGRVLFAPTLLAHNDDASVANKPVTYPTSEPYRRAHAQLQLFGADSEWRVESWDFTLDNFARPTFYHGQGAKPFESPPEGVLYDVGFRIAADGHLATGAGNRLLRDIVRDQVKSTATLKYVRTANQDEFQVNLTDVVLVEAPKHRSRGKIYYDVRGHCRASTFQWVDANAARYFPA